MLRLNSVSKTFSPGTVNEKRALTDLTLHIRQGDFVTIIGANGAGKSTLFNLICGTFYPDAGEVYLDGKNVTMEADHVRARQIGRLFQDPKSGTAPDMSIEENLALAAGNGGWLSRVSAADKRAFRERLSLLGMGLENRMRHPVGLLSGGQRQALTLLMAVMSKPDLLLLDEHTAALDPANAKIIMDLTLKFAQEYGLTVMMITHNMQHALNYGNRLLMMDSGEIIMDIAQQEKAVLTMDDIVTRFRQIKNRTLENDAMLLQ